MREKIDESVYVDISLGGIALFILYFLMRFYELMDWMAQTLVGAIVATFFFSPLMSWITGKEKTIREKTLFVIGAILYLILYLYMADLYKFVVTTLQGIVVYAFVSSVVKFLYWELSKYLP